MLTLVGRNPSKVGLINTTSGIPYTPIIVIDNLYYVTEKEMNKLTKGQFYVKINK